MLNPEKTSPIPGETPQDGLEISIINQPKNLTQTEVWPSTLFPALLSRVLSLDQETIQTGFENRLGLWKEGEFSSHLLFPYLLKHILASDHKIAGAPLNKFDQHDLATKLFSSTQVNNVAFLGIDGQNPSREDILRGNYNLPYLNLVKRRNRIYKSTKGEVIKSNLQVPGLAQIDEQLPRSMLAHLYYANWMRNLYPKKQERYGTKHERNAFKDNTPNKKEAYALYDWTTVNSLIRFADKLAVSSLLPLTEQMKIHFPDFEAFTSRIAPAFFFKGWGKKLTGTRTELERRLPPHFQKEEKRILLSAAFMELDKDKTKILGEIIQELSINQNPEEAKSLLIETCALALTKGEPSPLKQWAIDDLGIRTRIEKRVLRIKQDLEEEEVKAYKLTVEQGKATAEKQQQQRLAEQTQEANQLSEYVLNNLAEIYDIPDIKTANLDLTLSPTPENIMEDKDLRIVFQIKNGHLPTSTKPSGIICIVPRRIERLRNYKDQYSLDNARGVFESLFDPESSKKHWQIDSLDHVEEI